MKQITYCFYVAFYFCNKLKERFCRRRRRRGKKETKRTVVKLMGMSKYKVLRESSISEEIMGSE